MTERIRKAATVLLAAAVLAAGISLPSLSFFLQDRSSSEQIVTDTLLRPSEKESLFLCHMLRMAYITEKQIILSTGRYLSPEEAFTQAKLSLEGLQAMALLSLNWEHCTLQDYTIAFRVSGEDLSRRMILWSLSVQTADGAAIRITLDDKTGMVLGFSYSDTERPFYTAQIPPAEIQIGGQALVDFFSDYWNVSVISDSVISNSGDHILTVTDKKNAISTELPFSMDANGFYLNLSK